MWHWIYGYFLGTVYCPSPQGEAVRQRRKPPLSGVLAPYEAVSGKGQPRPFGIKPEAGGCERFTAAPSPAFRNLRETCA